MSSNILYSNVSSLPNISHGYFHRQNLDKLLTDAIEYPFVTVTAGAGYGKTQAVSAFLYNTDIPFVWLQLSSLDNLTTRFWESFVYAVAIQNPYMANRFTNSKFPHTEAQFDDFLHRLADAITEIGKIIFVFDDFHLIEEPNIMRFFENLLSARLKDLTIILISRSNVNLNIPGKLTNNLLIQITEDNLRFTLEETGAYIKMQGILIPPEILHKIYLKTEGWISAIYLTGLSLKRSKSASDNIMAIAKQQIFELIEQEIFSVYTQEVQKLLIELSVLDDFSLDLLKELVDLDIILEISKTNTFIYFNPVTKNYRFHNLFSEFLLEKLAYMQDDKIKDVYLKIADWYYNNDFKVDALVYYEKCGKYNKICEILCHYKIDIPFEEAQLFLNLIERIPHEFIDNNPIMRVIHARLLLNNGRVQEASDELIRIRNEFSALPDIPENKAILGETYLFQALICLLDKNLYFAKLYEMADECLPNGSSLIDNRLFINNGGTSVAIGNADAGEVQKYIQAIAYAAPYASRVMHGCCYGTDFMTKAEASYYFGDMAEAEGNAFKAIYRAQQVEQNDIVCCAYFILIRLSIAAGSFERASGYLEELKQKIGYPNNAECLRIIDVFMGWFYVKLGDTEKIADWIKNEERSSRIISPNSTCYDWFVRAYYLLHNENYYELSAYTEYLEKMYAQKGFLISKLETQIIKSIVAYKIGDLPLSISALQEAYELAHANNLIMQFVEQGSNMRAVIEAALKNGGHTIPEEWLNNIKGKANTYAKKLNIVIEQYNASIGLTTDKQYNLTNREKEILRYLCEGFNREEIAKNLYISINTVKSSMQNIYNKLGANNKADAVRIATQMGLDH